jgi:hypothetical protein
MIGYHVSDSDLNGRIVKENAKWPARAKRFTHTCRKAGKFVDQGSIWSEIKLVFMEQQHDKCCYCERKLESKEFGKIEHDVEHFRPKSRVQDWFTLDVLADFADWPATLRRSGASSKGYYKLAFDPRNYATACKTCNSALKRDYFPIGGTRRVAGASPSALKTEKPFLIFPLSDWDEAPDSLIRFEGITAVPIYTANRDLFRHWRARITIRFFRLNRSNTQQASVGAASTDEEEGRENLYRERADALNNLAKSLRAIERETSAKIREAHVNDVKRLTSRQSPHTNCCRSFAKFWVNNRKAAVELWLKISAYLNSQGLS